MNFIHKNVYSIILVLTGITFLYFCLPFIGWILFAGIIAFALKPIQNNVLIRKFRFNKTVSVYVILISILLVIFPFVLAFLTFFSEGKKISENIKTRDSIHFVEESVQQLYSNYPSLASIVDQSIAETYLKNGIQRVAEPLLIIASQLFLSLPMLFLSLFIFSACLYYFIADSEEFHQFIISLELIDREELDELTRILQLSCQSTVFAAFITGTVQSLIIAGTAASIGVNFFFTIFFITMFLAQIPIVGTLPITAALVLYFYFRDNNAATVIMVVSGVVAGLSDNIIRPWVLSKYDSLHPFAGLMSSLGALLILGPIGVLLGPVITLVFFRVLQKQYKPIIADTNH